MNDRDQKMMTEIGKVIMNILDSEGGVTLPSIGVIKRVDESYELANDGVGGYTSLVDALEGMSGVSRRQAEALYGCWLDVAQMEDGVYSIDMIGTVKGGELIVEQKLFSKLNDGERTREVPSISEVLEQVAAEEMAAEIVPEPVVEESPKEIKSEPKAKKEAKKEAKKKSGGNPLLYVVAAVVFIGAAIYGFVAVGDVDRDVVETPQTEAVAVVEEVVKPEIVAEVQKPEPEPVAVEELYLEKGEQPRLRTYKGRTISDDEALAVFEQAVGRSSEVATKRFQVALGVYTYGSNVGRLIVDFEQFLGDNAVPTYVAQYGKSRLVSLFGSDSMAECERFVAEVGSKLTGNLWICKIK